MEFPSAAMTIRFHPSSIGCLMGAPKSIDPEFLKDADLATLYRKKSKTEADQAALAPYWERTLSEGAKSYCKLLASQQIFGYRKMVTTKVLEKGLTVEQDTIDLYNSVLFTRHVKNTERRMNDFLTGECDIYVPGECTKDVKSSWSLDTFPLLPEDCHESIYEWQGVAYGILWPDTQYHELAYGMVDTPDELIKWITDDERAAHKVSHIDPVMRITRLIYKKDPEKARLLEVKARVAQKYIESIIARFMADRDQDATIIVPAAPEIVVAAPAPATDWRAQILQSAI